VHHRGFPVLSDSSIDRPHLDKLSVDLNHESMKIAVILALWSVVITVGVFAQEETPTFKMEVKSAFVWGEDVPGGAVSWTAQDPLTGAGVLKLRYAGVEVSSRMGFEKIQSEQVQEFIAYTTTIANSTNSALSVDYGGMTVDGHLVPPLSTIPGSKALELKSRKNQRGLVQVEQLYCFSSGFLSEARFLPTNEQLSTLTVAPQHSLTVSGVIRDPRPYPILCSVEGCLPKGTIRYIIRVGSRDYVFIWPGRSIVNCGK